MKKKKTKIIPKISRQLKLKPEQVHKPAKTYDRKKQKQQLKKLLKNVR